MKKTYIQPIAERVEFAPQGMMALSVNSTADAPTVDGSDAYSRGFNFEDDLDWDEEE